MIKCKRCSCQIFPEHEKLSCHAHNDTNLWRPWDSKGRELFEVLRTRVIEEEAHDAKV